LKTFNAFIARPLGAIKLRGKEKEIALNALSPRTELTLSYQNLN
jgi:hypothetical protein